MSEGATQQVDPESPTPGSQPARRSMARNFLHLGMGQVGTTVLAVVLSGMLGRSLTEAEFGNFNVFVRNYLFAFVLVDWGQSQYLLREVARRPERARTLLGGALAIRAGGGLLAAGAVGAITFYLLGYDARTCLLGVLALLTMLPGFLSQGYGLVFRGRERMENDALVSVFGKLVTLGATAALLRLGLGLPGAIVAQVVGGCAALALAMELGRRLGVSARAPDRSVIRELLVGGTPLVMMYVASEAQRSIDANVVKALVPEDVLGWFGAANFFLGTLMAPASILGTATFPRLARAARDRDEFRAELQTGLKPVLLMAGYVTVGTFVCAHLAVDLIFGTERFDAAGTILQVFAPSFFLFFVDVLLGAAIVACGRASRMAMAKLINVGTSTLLGLWLVPVFQARHGNGGLGAAIAYGASEFIMFASILAILPRGAVGRAFLFDFIRALVSAGGAIAAAVVLRPLSWSPVAQSSWLGTALALGIATVVFAALAWATRLFTKADLGKFLALVRRRGGER